MPREAKADKRERTAEIVRRLRQEYPDARCALDHENPFQLLVATILSAQCTDKKVNQVTGELFKAYPTPAELAEANAEDVEAMIRPTGFYRNKTRSIRGAARTIVEEHDGEVPRTMAELLELPGVARKTANVVLGNAFDKNVGVVVDTHVQRLSRRLKLTYRKNNQGDKLEKDLMDLVPREDWTDVSHLLIFHGRNVCTARKPACERCVLRDLCPSAGKV